MSRVWCSIIRTTLEVEEEEVVVMVGATKAMAAGTSMVVEVVVMADGTRSMVEGSRATVGEIKATVEETRAMEEETRDTADSRVVAMAEEAEELLLAAWAVRLQCRP